MTKHALLVVTVLVLLWSQTGPLYGFGSATHAYIAREVDAVKNDYAAELAATVTQVRKELESHGIAGAG